jgi:hypothetical protein
MKPRSRVWDDDGIDPLKGGNPPGEFLKSNFKLLGPGGVFRTVKAKFPPKVIEAAAKKAGVSIQIQDLDPWLKVTIVGKK